MDASWFRLQEFLASPYARRDWVPLLGTRKQSQGSMDDPVYEEQFEGVAASIFPARFEKLALSAEWDDVWGRWPTRAGVNDGTYFPPLRVDIGGTEHAGELLVGVVDGGAGQPDQWLLHQDLVLALQLLHSHDEWIRPDEEDVVVARLQRDDDSNPRWLEIRVEHLRDYLAAVSAGVLVASYVSRRQNREDIASLGWESDTARAVQGGTWKGFYRPLKELPTLRGAQTEGYYVEAQLRRYEWVRPAASSPRVARHEDPVQVEYIVHADGTRKTAKQLSDEYSITPLFFHPRLGRDILLHPQGVIEWDTHDTGQLGFHPYGHCRFSVNGLGLISVVAVDVAQLPRTLQHRFVAHNVTPEGGIALEAYRMWFEAEWIESEAPENRLAAAQAQADAAATTALGAPLYREHESRAEIVRQCSRFRAVDAEGFRTLAKDVCRVAIDALNPDVLKQQTSDMDPKTGSLKRLEEILTRHGADGHAIMGPLFAVYDLRQDDAHLPSGDRRVALALLHADEGDPWVRNGERLLEAVSSTLTAISDVLAPTPSANTDRALPSDDDAG